MRPVGRPEAELPLGVNPLQQKSMCGQSCSSGAEAGAGAGALKPWRLYMGFHNRGGGGGGMQE